MGDVTACRLVTLPRLDDHRGSLTVVEPGDAIAFEIRRVYYLYSTPAGMERGAHEHRQLQQLFVAVAGAFEIEVDDGSGTASFHLSRPDQGLYVGPMIWRTLRNFAPGSVCVVLASERYDESDYFRDYDDFLAAARNA